MSIKVNDNFFLRAPKPLDDRIGEFSGGVWNYPSSVAAFLANTAITPYRYPSLTVTFMEGGIQKEYWFVGGVADADFKLKLTSVPTPDNLQEVTTGVGNNATSNVVIIDGEDNSDVNRPGMTLSFDGVGGIIRNQYGFGEYSGDIAFTSIGTQIRGSAINLDANSSTLILGDESGLVAGATFNKRVSIQNSTLDNEAITQGQVNTSLNLKANISGQIFTGNISAPNLSGTNTGDQDLAPYQLRSEKGQPNGYAGLDSGAKILLANLPDSILGQVTYMGTWNASTNTPTLISPPASSTKGDYYITSVAGTQFGISFLVGDWIISNGVTWDKVDNTDAVMTVFGRIGNILALASDYSSFYPLLSGSYVNPTWIESLPYSKITGTPDLSVYELLANKQNSLAVDGTNTKYPTVTAVNSGLVLKEDVSNKQNSLTADPSNLKYPTVTATNAGLDRRDFLSTGLIAHAALSATVGSTVFDISSGFGVITDFTTANTPTITHVAITAKTGITPQFLNSSITSYVAIDVNNNVVQSASPFTAIQRRNLIVLGAIIHSNLATINTVNNIAAPIITNTNQLHDLFEAVGALNTSGNKYTANGANLNIDKSSGTIFKLGINFINNWREPNALTLGVQTALTFRYRTQTGTEFADTTVIDPGFYDVAGTRTAIPGSPNQFTIQRITIFQSGLTRIQYGQNLFASKTDAIAALGVAPFVTETNIAENGIFRAYLVVRANATTLNDLAQAEFIEVGKFGSPIGNAGGAVTFANIVAALGYTPENVANKAINLTSPDNTKYPSTLAVSNEMALKLNLTGGTLTGLLNSTNSINATGFVGIGVGNSNSSALSVSGLEISTSSFSQRLYGPATTPSVNTVLRFPLDLSGTVALTSGELDNIKLPRTTASNIGIIYKNNTPFLHDYKPASNDGLNIFIGENAGNFTMTGPAFDDASYNIGIGNNSLSSVTSAYVNIAIGGTSMDDTTSGDGNVGVGFGTLKSNTAGDHNVAIGYGALGSVNGNMGTLIGYENTAIGFFAGSTITTGKENIFIGNNAGSGVGSKVDAVNSMALGAHVNIAADNTYYYGNGSVQNHIFAGNQTWYGTTTTGITGSGNIVLSQSPSFSGTINAQDLTLGAKLIWGTGIFNAGESALFNTATLGTVMTVKDGSSKNFVLSRQNGTGIFSVPTASSDVNFDANISAVMYSGGASLTGTPTAPTPTAGDNSTKIATTAFVAGKANLTGGNSFTGGQVFTNGTTQAIIATSEISMSTTADSTAFSLTLDGGLLLNTSGTSGANGIISSDNLTAQRTHQMADVTGTTMILSTDTAPATSGSTGKTGTVIISGGFRYECISANSWVRSAVSTF